MGRIHSVLSTPPAIQDGPDGLERSRGEIEFRELTYSYPDAPEPALRDISLKVRPGEMLAIVGTVGSGKTTLVDMLTRASDPPEGSVFLDGVDVRSLKLADLRRQFGVAPQESFLFTETIEDNIRMGAVGKADVPEAAGAAQIVPETFPAGLDAMLGERGVNLSGGQKQRVSLARAIVRGAPVVILDDALSAVDAETEETIIENLRKVREGCTVLMISHRIKAAREADRIAVMDAGRIVELGTHEELIKKKGLYLELVEQQSWGSVFDGR
jgi:ATP-binding cassette subfamily B protein